MGCCNHSQKHVDTLLMAQRPSFVPGNRAKRGRKPSCGPYAITANQTSHLTGEKSTA